MRPVVVPIVNCGVLRGGGEEGRYTIPRPIVLARVRGWFFMKSLGAERPITITIRNSWKQWRGSFQRGSKRFILGIGCCASLVGGFKR